MTEPTTLSFDAGLLARGWLSAFLATGNDPETPILHQTIALEQYGTTGIRLTATDRYMLLTAWIPTLDAGEPEIDEAPTTSLVLRDNDLRARGLLTYLRKLSLRAAKENLPLPEVNVHLGLEAEEGDAPGFPGMELEQIAVEYPDNEMVRCDLVEGTYPDWRALLSKHKPVKTDRVTLNPDLLARISALGKLHGSTLTFTPGGARKMVGVEPAEDDLLVIRGGLMPIRTAESVADVA